MYRSNQVGFLQSLAETDLWSWFAPAPPSTAKIIAMKMRIPIFLSNDIVIYGYTSCDQR